jgi:hypothetical protein
LIFCQVPSSRHGIYNLEVSSSHGDTSHNRK